MYQNEIILNWVLFSKCLTASYPQGARVLVNVGEATFVLSIAAPPSLV